MLKHQVYKNSICLIDSYSIRKRSEMKSILNQLKTKYPSHPIFTRSDKSLIREWRSHNLLYLLGIKKLRTKDVDFDINQKWYYKLGYFILSILYL